MRWVLLSLLLPLVLLAQEVVLVSVNPATTVESAIPSAGYNWGQVAAGDGLDYAVERGGATWIEHVSLIDNSLRVLNTVSAARTAILRDGEILLALDDGVHRLRSDGTDTVLAAPAVQSFVAMGDGCVEFVSPQGMWGFDWLRNQLFLLPGVVE